MKHLITNQNFLQIKVPLFHVFGRLHEFSFVGLHIYVSKATLLMFDWINIPQIVVDFAIY